MPRVGGRSALERRPGLARSRRSHRNDRMRARPSAGVSCRRE